MGKHKKKCRVCKKVLDKMDIESSFIMGENICYKCQNDDIDADKKEIQRVSRLLKKYV